MGSVSIYTSFSPTIHNTFWASIYPKTTAPTTTTTTDHDDAADDDDDESKTEKKIIQKLNLISNEACIWLWLFNKNLN